MSLQKPHKKLILWNNTASGAATARDLWEAIAADPDAELVETDSSEQAQSLASSAAEAGVGLLVAAGGDGSIHNVVQGLMSAAGATTALGIVPLGTGNDLCRTLAIPLDPLLAWAAIQEGRTEAVDITRVSTREQSRFFTNCSNGGNSSRLLETLTEQMKHDWGDWAYLRAAVQVLSDLRVYQVALTCDDAPREEFSAWNVVLANGNTTGGGIQIAPRASLVDGMLDVIVILDGTALDIAAMATDLLTGDYLDHANVVYRQARRLTLEIDPAVELIVDGEAIAGGKFQFEVMPRALQVVVGPEF